MRFASPLLPGTLLRRYKRFLADVILKSGEIVTAACPNTGAMLGLNQPGSPVWLSRSESPTRKYPHTWELVKVVGLGLVGVSTAVPNTIAVEAISAGILPDLHGYSGCRREVKYGRKSRIDILLTDPGQPDCYVEVKNTHLFRHPGIVEFPDCVTERGTKHLEELTEVAKAGCRAAMLYVVQAEFPSTLALAEDIDPNYVKAFRRARRAGVEAFALCCKVTTSEIVAIGAIPVLEP